MRRNLLIGLIGHKGSGKSTSADILVELIPSATIIPWAYALKGEVADFVEMMDWTNPFSRPSHEEMERLKGEIYGPLCQGWGAYRRHQDPEYWIKAWEREAGQRVIVPDCRHHNEVEYLKAHGGVLVHIDGPSHWEGDTRSVSHESERFVRELAEHADHFIDNYGTLQHLRQQLTFLVSILVEAGARVGLAA